MEHFIKNIEITNFKSIRHAEVKDCRRVNIFVGYPNVGKSNILEGLSLFCVLQGWNFKDLIRATTDPTLFFNGQISEEIKIKIDDKFEISGVYKNEKIDLSLFILKLRGLLSEELWYDLAGKLPYRYITSTYTKFDNSPVINGPTLSTQTNINHPKIKKYDFKKNIDSRISNFQVLDFPFGNNLFSIIQSNSEIRKDLGSLLKPYNLKMLFDSNYQSFSLQKTIDEESVFSVDYSLIADTLQRLFFYKTAIQSNKEQILLLEEPESHMFPPYISKMTGDITYDKNNNQFFIATHSPYVLGDLIRDVEPDELSVCIVDYDAAKGETIIHRMNEEEVNEAYQFGHDFFMNINNFLPKEQHEQV